MSAPVPVDEWECGPHANAWGGHDVRCRKVPATPPADEQAAPTAGERDTRCPDCGLPLTSEGVCLWRDAPDHPASPPADDATPSERDGWSRCTKTMFGRCNDGRMEPWRGSDGHGGTEWFSTCDRCGVTS